MTQPPQFTAKWALPRTRRCSVGAWSWCAGCAIALPFLRLDPLGRDVLHRRGDHGSPRRGRVWRSLGRRRRREHDRQTAPEARARRPSSAELSLRSCIEPQSGWGVTRCELASRRRPQRRASASRSCGERFTEGAPSNISLGASLFRAEGSSPHLGRTTTLRSGRTRRGTLWLARDALI